MSKKSNVVPLQPAGAVAGTPKTSARELRSLQAQSARRARTRTLPLLRLGDDKKLSIDHADGATGFTLLMEAMGTAHFDFAQGLLNQLCNVADANRTGSEGTANFALGIVTGMEPNDQVEAMMLSQMAAIQMAMMTMARRCALADNLPMLESYDKSLNKLARTFATQVEALKKYRSKGEQRVYVERVNVEQGGQAIVGNVATGEGQK